MMRYAMCANTIWNFPLKIFPKYFLLHLLIFFSIMVSIKSFFLVVKFDISREIARAVTNESFRLTFPETYIWNERTNQCNRRRNGFKLEFQHSFLLVLVWILRVLSGMRNIARNFVIQWKNESDNKRCILITLLCNIWKLQLKRKTICSGRRCLRILKSHTNVCLFYFL